jgi:hypothetical protein
MDFYIASVLAGATAGAFTSAAILDNLNLLPRVTAT